MAHALKCMEILELLPDTHQIRSSVYHGRVHVFCDSGVLHSAQCVCMLRRHPATNEDQDEAL